MSFFMLLTVNMISCHGSRHKTEIVIQQCYMIKSYSLAPSLGVFHGAVQPGMGVPSSRVSHQACSSELDPGELSSNGILGNPGLIREGPLGLKAHVPRKRTVVFKGYQIFQGILRKPGVRQRFGRITVGNAHLLTSHPVGCCLC